MILPACVLQEAAQVVAARLEPQQTKLALLSLLEKVGPKHPSSLHLHH